MSMPSRVFRRARFGCAFVVVAATLAACGNDDTPATTSTGPSNPATETFAPALGVNIGAMQKKDDNLYVQDLTVGTGTEAVAGRTAVVTYTGWLKDGTQFDSNVGGTPFPVQNLGSAQVIAGWNQGLQGMKVGGKRKLVIGSALGYGASGNGPIGPNATLVFDVTLLNVQ